MTDALTLATLIGIDQKKWEENQLLEKIANQGPAKVVNTSQASIDLLYLELAKAYSQIKALKETLADQENMLTLPMAELVKKTGKFAETYFLQQKSLASWAVSQRGWKKLAIIELKAKGMTDEEINKAFQESRKESIMEMSNESPKVGVFKEELLKEKE